MMEDATAGRTAIKVRKINETVKMMEGLEGFHVVSEKGDGEAPAGICFEEGLQPVYDPVSVSLRGGCTKSAVVQECKSRWLSEVLPDRYTLPNGLVLEFFQNRLYPLTVI